MKTPWSVPDIIDLEYLVYMDDIQAEKQGGEESLAQRDRQLFLREVTQPDSGSCDHDNSLLLWIWLRAMRKDVTSRQSAVLPGTIWKEVYGLFSWLLPLSGVLAGAGIALSLLVYSGKTPVNVFLFLAALVLPQLLLLSCAVLAYLAKSFIKRDVLDSPALSLLFRLFSAVVRRLSKTVYNRMDQARYMDIHALLCRIRARRQVYGNLLFWPFFILFQLFGMGFNAGALAAILLRVAGSDLAFGWQSTLQIGSETVYRIVRFLATPWSWFMPVGIAFPGLEQVEGTRMILKEGIYHLATSDLVSWWPFLCLCLLFYGLLPRMLLFFYGRFMLSRSLAGLRFQALCFRAIVRRMTGPHLTTAGKCEVVEDTGLVGDRTDRSTGQPQPAGQESVREADQDQRSAADESVLVILPDELLDILGHDNVTCMAHGLGLIPQAVLGIDEVCDLLHDPCGRQVREHLTGHARQCSILFVQEGWQPPIQETLLLIKDLRTLSGPECPIIVGLVGRPEPDGGFMPVSHEEFSVWRQKVAILGDTELCVERAAVSCTPGDAVATSVPIDMPVRS